MKKLLLMLLIGLAAYTTQAQVIPIQTQLDTLAARQSRQNQGFGDHINTLYRNNGTRQAEIRSLRADSITKTAQIASLKIDSANKEKVINSLSKLVADGGFIKGQGISWANKTLAIDQQWLNERYTSTADFNNLLKIYSNDAVERAKQTIAIQDSIIELNKRLDAFELWRKQISAAIKLLPLN